MQITLKLSKTPPELNFENRTAHTLTATFSDGITEEFLDVSEEACFRQFESHLHNNRPYLVSTLQGEDELGIPEVPPPVEHDPFAPVEDPHG